jgi:hypothetical protein
MAKARGCRSYLIAQPANKIFIFMNQREVALREISDKYEEINKIKILQNQIDNADSVESNVDTTQKQSHSADVNPPDSAANISNAPVDYDLQIDYLRVDIAKSAYELARIHFNIGNYDSANYYYKLAANAVPLTQESSSRYLYVYAESIRDTNE